MSDNNGPKPSGSEPQLNADNAPLHKLLALGKQVGGVKDGGKKAPA